MASTVSPAETTGAFSSNGDTRASTASPVASMPPPPTTPPTSVCSDYAPSSPIMGMKIYFLFFFIFSSISLPNETLIHVICF